MSRTLFKSTTSFASMTFISRILGFIRDVVIALFFGATASADAFFVAFKIPNFMRRLFAEGAFSQAFVPVLSQWSEEREHQDVQDFINHIFGSLFIVLILLVLFAEIFAPILIMIFAPGFYDEPTRYQLAVDMLRVTFPYLLFISLTAMAAATLNTYGIFGPPALTPVLLNIALIIAAIVVSPYFEEPIKALAWGVFAAGIFQLLFQWPFLRKIRLVPRLRWGFNDPGVKRVLKLMIPALFGVSVAQINLMVDTIFASLLPVGSVSWLYYSDRLMQFPLGVFGVAIATVILPSLSRKHSNHSKKEYADTLDWGLRSLLLIGTPAALGLFLLSGPLLTTLLNYGAFHQKDVLMAKQSLMAFSFGLPSFMAVKVLASGFYSKQNIKTPVKIAATAMLLNILLVLLLIKPLAHAGLALATSLSAYANAGLLMYKLKLQKTFHFTSKSRKFLWQLLFANILMGLFLWYFTSPLEDWLNWTWKTRSLHLMLLVSIAIVLYFTVLWLSGVRKRDFLQASF